MSSQPHPGTATDSLEPALVAVFAAHIPEPIRTIVGLLGVAAGALATWWNRRKPRRS